jgi:hypothetical protein
MKKFWVLASALTLALGLAACSDKSEGSSEKKEAPKEEKVNMKREFVNFYSDIKKTINENDADLNAYETAAETPTADMKTKASDSAAAVAAALNSLQVPATIKDQKADLEAAVKEIASSYQAKSDELKKDAPSLDAANATFQQGVDKLGASFESVKLLKPNLAKEI